MPRPVVQYNRLTNHFSKYRKTLKCPSAVTINTENQFLQTKTVNVKKNKATPLEDYKVGCESPCFCCHRHSISVELVRRGRDQRQQIIQTSNIPLLFVIAVEI